MTSDCFFHLTSIVQMHCFLPFSMMDTQPSLSTKTFTRYHFRGWHNNSTFSTFWNDKNIYNFWNSNPAKVSNLTERIFKRRWADHVAMDVSSKILETKMQSKFLNGQVPGKYMVFDLEEQKYPRLDANKIPARKKTVTPLRGCLVWGSDAIAFLGNVLLFVTSWKKNFFPDV